MSGGSPTRNHPQIGKGSILVPCQSSMFEARLFTFLALLRLVDDDLLMIDSPERAPHVSITDIDARRAEIEPERV